MGAESHLDTGGRACAPRGDLRVYLLWCFACVVSGGGRTGGCRSFGGWMGAAMSSWAGWAASVGGGRSGGRGGGAHDEGRGRLDLAS